MTDLKESIIKAKLDKDLDTEKKWAELGQYYYREIYTTDIDKLKDIENLIGYILFRVSNWFIVGLATSDLSIKLPFKKYYMMDLEYINNPFILVSDKDDIVNRNYVRTNIGKYNDLDRLNRYPI